MTEVDDFVTVMTTEFVGGDKYLCVMDKSVNKFVAILAIIATPLAAGAFLMAWGPGNHYFDFSPANDGYVAPRDISKMISEIEDSTVTVFCDVSKTRGDSGTGWVIDPAVLQVDTTDTVIITNHHVIAECIGLEGSVSISKLFGKKRPAEITYFDKKNDLAVLETEVKLEPLELSKNIPWPGYWAMVVGSADGYEGSVAIGNVLNVTTKDILITNNISQGNSGGSIVDNEGKVIGVVTWGMNYRKSQYNGGGTLDRYCSKILKCKYEYEGEKTWFDYNE